MINKNLKILFITDIHQNITALKRINFSEFDLVLCGGDIIDVANPDLKIAEEIINIFPENSYIVPGNCDKGDEIINLINNKLINIHFKKIDHLNIPIAGIGYSKSLKDDLQFYRQYFNSDEKIIDFHKNSKMSFILNFCGIKINNDKIILEDEEETLKLRSDYFNKFVSFNENEIDLFFKNIDTLNKGILITHSPPSGFLDKLDGLPNAGSIAIRNGILKTKPKLVLCGHFHELAGKINFKETIIFNPGALKENKIGVISIKNDIIDVKTEFI